MKELLEEKAASLQKSVDELVKKQMELTEQICMHRGAMQYNSVLLKELADAEAAKTGPVAVPAAE